MNNIEINDFVWKSHNGSEVRMMDMDIVALQKAYNHCTDMLWNKKKLAPGKIEVRKNIHELIENCNTQLFINWLIREIDHPATQNTQSLFKYISEQKANAVNLGAPLNNDDSVTELFNGLPSEFNTITIDRLLSGCFDKLGVINRRMISDEFILAQGLWLTKEEKTELLERDENGKIRPWLDVIKERLFLQPNVRIRIKSDGLSYTELRALVHLEQTAKIANLNTITLTLLRDKIFPQLDYGLNYHIEKWNKFKSQIERVAEYKNIQLVMKSY